MPGRNVPSIELSEPAGKRRLGLNGHLRCRVDRAIRDLRKFEHRSSERIPNCDSSVFSADWLSVNSFKYYAYGVLLIYSFFNDTIYIADFDMGDIPPYDPNTPRPAGRYLIPSTVSLQIVDAVSRSKFFIAKVRAPAAPVLLVAPGLAFIVYEDTHGRSSIRLPKKLSLKNRALIDRVSNNNLTASSACRSQSFFEWDILLIAASLLRTLCFAIFAIKERHAALIIGAAWMDYRSDYSRLAPLHRNRVVLERSEMTFPLYFESGRLRDTSARARGFVLRIKSAFTPDAIYDLE